MKYSMLGDANNAGPVRLSDTFDKEVGGASAGVAASQKALYEAYNSLNSSKLDNNGDGIFLKSGGNFDGDAAFGLRCINSNVDARQADNNVSTTTWVSTAQICDTNQKILSKLETIIGTAGSIGAQLYVRNYKQDGTQIAQKGIRMNMDKTGALTYGVDEPVNFLYAISSNILWVGTGSYVSSSYSHETAIKNFIDTKIPATSPIKICFCQVICGSSRIYIVQKYTTHAYASYIGMGYDGVLVIGKKQNGTWSAQKTVASC